MPDITPKPFLLPLFKNRVKPFISAGYHYDSKEIAVHGITNHQAIDFDVPRGTTVYAPTDGYYVATFGEVLLIDGSHPRMLNNKVASVGNFYSEDIKPPGKRGSWKIWFGGLFIQGWHTNGMYTQYGHLDFVEHAIPYYPPAESGNNLLYSEILKTEPRQFKRRSVATYLKAGTPIGKTGMTGMGWGPRSYDFAVLDNDTRPNFLNTEYTHYNSPHLHFAVFGPRDEITSEPDRYYDPFGIYDTLHAAYPKSIKQWPGLKNSLWITG